MGEGGKGAEVERLLRQIGQMEVQLAQQEAKTAEQQATIDALMSA